MTQKKIARAVTNDPALSDAEFQLGDKSFKIVDLPYRDYVKFLSYLQPLLEAVAARLAGMAGMEGVTGPSMGVADMLRYCSESLPEMAQIVCRQTEPDITVDDVMQLGKTPFRLAALVLKQVEQNNIVAEVGDFFVQILPFLRVPRKLTTEAIPSSS